MAGSSPTQTGGSGGSGGRGKKLLGPESALNTDDKQPLEVIPGFHPRPLTKRQARRRAKLKEIVESRLQHVKELEDLVRKLDDAGEPIPEHVRKAFDIADRLLEKAEIEYEQYRHDFPSEDEQIERRLLFLKGENKRARL